MRGETLEEHEAQQTHAVVARQIGCGDRMNGIAGLAKAV